MSVKDDRVSRDAVFIVFLHEYSWNTNLHTNVHSFGSTHRIKTNLYEHGLRHTKRRNTKIYRFFDHKVRDVAKNGIESVAESPS